MVQKGPRKNARPECHVPRATYLVIQNFLGSSRGDELNFWEQAKRKDEVSSELGMSIYSLEKVLQGLRALE